MHKALDLFSMLRIEWLWNHSRSHSISNARHATKRRLWRVPSFRSHFRNASNLGKTNDMRLGWAHRRYVRSKLKRSRINGRTSAARAVLDVRDIILAWPSTRLTRLKNSARSLSSRPTYMNELSAWLPAAVLAFTSDRSTIPAVRQAPEGYDLLSGLLYKSNNSRCMVHPDTRA